MCGVLCLMLASTLFPHKSRLRRGRTSMNSLSSAASSRSRSSVLMFADTEPEVSLVVMPGTAFLFRAFRGFLVDGVEDFAIRGVARISRKRWKFACSDASIVASAFVYCLGSSIGGLESSYSNASGGGTGFLLLPAAAACACTADGLRHSSASWKGLGHG